jgi:hypothetical protein
MLALWRNPSHVCQNLIWQMTFFDRENRFIL